MVRRVCYEGAAAIDSCRNPRARVEKCDDAEDPSFTILFDYPIKCPNYELWLIDCEPGSMYPLTYQIICSEGEIRTWKRALLPIMMPRPLYDRDFGFS